MPTEPTNGLKPLMGGDHDWADGLARAVGGTVFCDGSYWVHNATLVSKGGLFVVIGTNGADYYESHEAYDDAIEYGDDPLDSDRWALPS